MTVTSARRAVQAGVLAVTLGGVFLVGANVETWCPFGGVEAAYTYLREGNLVCSLGISNFYVFGALILSAALLRRAFCGYACPIGTLSEWLTTASRRVGLPVLQVAPRIDRVLSMGKYLALVAILAGTWRLGELAFRGYCPAYVLVSRHGMDITYWAYLVAATVAAVSLFVTMPFCRWFCPMAAVLNPVARLGLARIKRDPSRCCGCSRCARSCPMAIRVDQGREVTASRCLSCMECIESCPAPDRPALSWGPPNWLGQTWSQAALIGILAACASAAAAAAYFAPLPSFVKGRGVAPPHVAAVELRIHGLTCRGRANLLVGFLERDDMYRILEGGADEPSYYDLEAWPDPETARVRVRYDSRCTDEDGVKRAITEPYYDMAENRWWVSPFVVEGYVPPGLNEEG